MVQPNQGAPVSTMSAATNAIGRGAFSFWFFFTWICGLFVLPVGLAVHFGGKQITSLLPQSWLAKHNADSTASLDVMENAAGSLFMFCIYSTFAFCGCILVKQMLFGKKKPKRPRPAAGASSSAAAEEDFSIANH